MKKQSCPTCLKPLPYSSRYPDYVCSDCVDLATDEFGEAVVFYNTEYSGHGCKGVYRKSQRYFDGHLCFIKGFVCYAEEAYMGGIVVRPV